MKILSVSNDNFQALLQAEPDDDIVVKHKDAYCIVRLKKTSNYDGSIKTVDTQDQLEYEKSVNALLNKGYKILSTGCIYGHWQGVLIKEF